MNKFEVLNVLSYCKIAYNNYQEMVTGINLAEIAVLNYYDIHDLEKNQEDLPDDERDVVVLYEGFCAIGSYDKTTEQWKVYDPDFEDGKRSSSFVEEGKIRYWSDRPVFGWETMSE